MSMFILRFKIELHEQVGLFNTSQHILDIGTHFDAAENLLRFVVWPAADQVEEFSVGFVFRLQRVVFSLQGLALRFRRPSCVIA